ncbi:GntR family transcriptional regulator [Microbacterium lacus]|uniref:GntR family transcriptional regulator n=1 Tax=Microbacterium lacus TaxID=415217 RepID=UPI00384EA375
MTSSVAYQPLSDHVYEHIRELILSGALAAGDRIKEREISDELQVSRVPVREALPLLESRGYIQILPRRGAIVKALTAQDIDDLFDVRESLEALAARSAARRVAESPENLAVAAALERMNELLRNAREAMDALDDTTLARANLAFHAEIISLAGNDLLARIFENILGRVEWLFRMTSDRDMPAQCAEHEGLYRAISAGQPDVAASLAFAHVASGRADSTRKAASTHVVI